MYCFVVKKKSILPSIYITAYRMTEENKNGFDKLESDYKIFYFYIFAITNCKELSNCPRILQSLPVYYCLMFDSTVQFFSVNYPEQEICKSKLSKIHLVMG